MDTSFALQRSLTPGEQAALSPGLWSALQAAGAHPQVVGRAVSLARIARLWRGELPILTLGARIFWLGAPPDCSAPGQAEQMAVLQHELQHVLDFATGRLGLVRYAADPRNWIYRYRLEAGRPWLRYGAEQRASMAEDLWRLEHGLKAGAGDLAALRRLIPWAN